MKILLAFLLLLPSAFAQLQLFTFDGTSEHPIGLAYDLGTAAVGDAKNVRLRVRNTGDVSVPLQTIAVAGPGFSIFSRPSPGYILAPTAAADFQVQFLPAALGSYSASLTVNTLDIVLRGSASAAAILSLDQTPLLSGAKVDFGRILRGGSSLKTFSLSNTTTVPITVGTVAVTGAGFRGPIGGATSIQLAPGDSTSFQVAFEPAVSTPLQGTLVVDQRTILLTGTGYDPPFPQSTITLAAITPGSGQQVKLSVQLAAGAPRSSSGSLSMEFKSSVAGVTDDPAVQFLATGSRKATFQVAEQDTAAKFGTSSSIVFQTGTTAGTIVFTLTLGETTAQATYVIAPAVPFIDTASGIRRVNALDIDLTGYDNGYSTSQLAFTFFDRSNRPLQTAIKVDTRASFQRYFATSKAGSAFSLIATFPVQGDATIIGAVDVDLTNTAGTKTVLHIPFP